MIGEGWSTVVVLPASASAGATGGPAVADGADDAKSLGARSEASEMLDSLTQAVDGGRMLTTSLVTVLFTDDGRVLAGAVTPERLLDAAATGR